MLALSREEEVQTAHKRVKDVAFGKEIDVKGVVKLSLPSCCRRIVLWAQEPLQRTPLHITSKHMSKLI